MSLLHEQDYVISHLRAAYLQSFHDGVGERVIKPSHLYITKTGPKDINWAANTLLSIASPSSPPIPVDSFNERVVQFRRGKAALAHTSTVRNSSVKRNLSRKLTKRGRSATYPELLAPALLEDDELAVEQTLNGTGPGASSLLSRSVMRHSTEDLLEQLQRTQLDDSDSPDDDEEEEDDDEDDDDDDDMDGLEDSGDEVSLDDNLMNTGNDFYSDSDLSALSEEDDSAIEDDLEYAAQQIKANMAADNSSSSLSMTLPGDRSPGSNTLNIGRSPRRRGTASSSSSGILPPPAPLVAPGLRRGTTSGSGERPAVTSSSTAAQQRRMSAPNRPRTKTNDSINGVPNTAPLNLEKTVKPRVSMEGDLFPKIAISAQETYSSSLSGLIKIKQATFDNPLEQYISASGKSERRPLKLKIYMPSCAEPKKPWQVLVRRDVNVANAIGFALYCYGEEKREPQLKDVLCDCNRWNLRIVEDDGEPDEDFPALDRTRMISGYSFDEFALVEATPAQTKENERKTPNTKKPTPAAAFTKSLENIRDKPNSDLPVSVIVFLFPFNELVSKAAWSDDVSPHTKIQTLVEVVCRDKALEVNGYVLKIAGTRNLLYPKSEVGSVQGALELTPKRVITQTNGYSSSDIEAALSGANIILSNASISSLRSATSTNPGTGTNGGAISRSVKKSTSTGNLDASYTPSTNNGGVFGARRNSTGGAEVPVEHATGRPALNSRMSGLVNSDLLPGALSAAGYEKYTVWRRQPMSFISRHERVLAIDGEYIHIMPSEERTWFDSPKTSSFHISQVIKVKQSSKVPSNFKIVVMKTSGPKRYDLEASTPAISAAIVAKIKNLALNYKK